MTTTTASPSGSVEDRRAHGKDAAKHTPLSSHAEPPPTDGRADPVELLIQQNSTREADLVPVRHGRMMVSPFTFFRGAAKVMASDLADTPTAGLMVQLCGDAHLSNFGGYASPERQLVFGLNDFDETLPGPFEYDLKRMATSFTIAARNNGFSKKDATAVTIESVRAYRLAMAEFAGMRSLDIWYAHLAEGDIQEAMRAFKDQASAPAKSGKGKSNDKRHGTATKDGKAGKAGKAVKGADARMDQSIKAAQKNLRKAHTRDSLHALSRYTEVVDGRYRIVSEPPVVVPVRDLDGAFGLSADQMRSVVDDQFQAYKTTLSNDRRQLLERFTIVDIARKVVGVGSVGTRAWIVLLQGRDHHDPLFLQVKEATRSVLEGHLPKTEYDTPGQRVVEGQRLMQESSDIFLGWTEGVQDDRYYYWRQLRDMKVSALVETMTPFAMTFYARTCGSTLARAHARSGDPVALAAYLGSGDAIDQAINTFSIRYADQNSRDYEAFVQAAKDGQIEAVHGT
jgi:uncharacterized protein (DUF2252 family)